jgi:hypothetical protein
VLIPLVATALYYALESAKIALELHIPRLAIVEIGVIDYCQMKAMTANERKIQVFPHLHHFLKF